MAALALATVVLTSCGGKGSTPAARAPAATATVEQGTLSATVSQEGILTYRSPVAVVNRAAGTYTELPGPGDEVGCGGVLYRVDDRPVLLLCGAVPAYRDLHVGTRGRDVRQLNRNLHVTGGAFTARTAGALRALQHSRGLKVTGALGVGDAVFLPAPARIAKVAAVLGGGARPGAPVLNATSDQLQVQVALDPSQQDAIKRGDRVQITLPGNTPVAGKVDGFGSYAHKSIPTYIDLDHAAKARGLEQAPVQVDITTKGVKNAINVPVVALVGKAGGGFAVEVVRSGGRRELVGVRLGLFDTGGGRVQVEGAVRPGDHVVVPSL